MDAGRVAANWARTWTRAWHERDVEAIVSFYAERALYRALIFREPDRAPILRFDTDGLIVDHRDYWNQVERRKEPYRGW